ncbi:Abi family protein [Brevibacterium litoralis]|uniref:Abi family protein n=1 Tax=Brevibacterium litoralis TaxID=3138935 RepID=UPI0032EC3926
MILLNRRLERVDQVDESDQDLDDRVSIAAVNLLSASRQAPACDASPEGLGAALVPLRRGSNFEPFIRDPTPSKHVQWLQRVRDQQASTDEQFVEHFRTKYDDRMPVWALTEILELGHLSVLYRGMNRKDAEEIARAFGVPGKRMMTSWLVSLNYVRNVSAHHARLFNRKLQNARSRPKIGQIPSLDHLQGSENAKPVYGTYNALAVVAYLLPSIEDGSAWSAQHATLLRRFPTTTALTIQSLGAPKDWESLALWQS